MRIIKKIKTNIFFKNIAVLASGSMIAQVIVVLCSPIITRVYSPDQIGVYSYLIAMVSTFTAVINLRYDMAIVTEDNEDNIYALIKLSLLVGILFTIIATIGFSFYFLMIRSDYTDYRYIVIFFFLLLLSNCLINVFNSYNNRKMEYKTMTSVYIIRTSVQNFGGILCGIFKLGILGLILPYTIGQYLGMKKQSKTLEGSFKEILHQDKNKLKELAKKYIQMPLFSVPAMFANSLSYSSITFFLENLYDMTTVGFYSLSTRILGLPLSLVSGNVSKVFFQEASEEYKYKNSFNRTFNKTILFLVSLSIPMGVVMYIFSPIACKIFFGSDWIIAGEYIQILTPYYMLRFIGTALSPGLIICNKQKQELLIQVLLVFTSVLSYFITINLSGSVEVFLWCICILKSIVYLLLIYIVKKNSKEVLI